MKTLKFQKGFKMNQVIFQTCLCPHPDSRIELWNISVSPLYHDLCAIYFAFLKKIKDSADWFGVMWAPKEHWTQQEGTHPAELKN